MVDSLTGCHAVKVLLDTPKHCFQTIACTNHKFLFTVTSLHKKWSFPLRIFFSKCNQMRIWSPLLKKSLIENSIFVQCFLVQLYSYLGLLKHQLCKHKKFWAMPWVSASLLLLKIMKLLLETLSNLIECNFFIGYIVNRLLYLIILYLLTGQDPEQFSGKL